MGKLPAVIRLRAVLVVNLPFAPLTHEILKGEKKCISPNSIFTHVSTQRLDECVNGQTLFKSNFR